MNAVASTLGASVRRTVARERHHPRFWFAFRIGAGIWLLALTALLYAYGVGGWWGVLLVPSGVTQFYWAFHFLR